ncbi:unnamed protein product [Acanthoscelides obtectus]|uniref:MADF domain-containing protein n=1 Tax=Acanthoscelides obtectus TaxID=200917 RepID=A0A9P0QD34_ACAOB|nr:unnamed protein product [Acanthoscelides obtectus]CAK1652141.1 hypothetical protein AOBTE_LOCUS17710 [Acanthoscelides obtectus]
MTFRFVIETVKIYGYVEFQRIDTVCVAGVTLVEDRPVLWDTTLDKYKDNTASIAGWREICVILMEDFEAMEQRQRQEFGKLVMKKWCQMRDT